MYQNMTGLLFWWWSLPRPSRCPQSPYTCAAPSVKLAVGVSYPPGSDLASIVMALQEVRKRWLGPAACPIAHAPACSRPPQHEDKVITLWPLVACKQETVFFIMTLRCWSKQQTAAWLACLPARVQALSSLTQATPPSGASALQLCMPAAKDFVNTAYYAPPGVRADGCMLTT